MYKYIYIWDNDPPWIFPGEIVGGFYEGAKGMELTPSPVLGPGTPLTTGQEATFGCWHHHQNPWVPNPIPRNPWAPNPKRQNLWAPNPSHWNLRVPNPSHRPNHPHLQDARVGPGGTPHTCLAFGRTKTQIVGAWRGKHQELKIKKLRIGRRKKKLGKKNNSLALTIPHKNVREIIKSICTAGGPRRRHHRQGTTTKAQRDGLAPILGRREGHGWVPPKGTCGGWVDTRCC